MDKVWPATFILKTYFPISVTFTHASLQLTHRHVRRLGDQTQEQKWMLKDSQFLPDCSSLCQIPHRSLRFDEAECFGEYRGRLPTSHLKLKKAWNIIFNFMILRKVSYLFRIIFITEIDFFNWQFHCTLFFQIHLSERIKGTGTETVHSTSARYQGCLKFVVSMYQEIYFFSSPVILIFQKLRFHIHRILVFN